MARAKLPKAPQTVFVTLKSKKIQIRSVRCEITIPPDNAGIVPIKCYFPLRDRRHEQLDFEFSLRGVIRDLGGTKRGEIRADSVYNHGTSTNFFGQGRGEIILHAEAVDYRETTKFPKEKPLPEGSVTSFWLTPCMLLDPPRSIGMRYDRGVEVKYFRVRRYRIRELGRTKFESHLLFHDDPNRDFAASSRLAATIKEAKPGAADKQLVALEQFLALTSFAGRQRCACYGYSRRKRGASIQQFRGDVGIPPVDDGYSRNDTLIDTSHFDAFVAACYPRLVRSPYGAFLTDAMTKLTGANRTLEADFTAYFAGLENLLNAFRDINNRQGILGATDWKTFEDDLKSFVQGHALFAHDKAKRGLLYGKLGELNRPSFKALLQEFAAVEGVNLAGLWPVVDPAPQGLNLYQIRNHIVHGRLLPHAAADA